MSDKKPDREWSDAFAGAAVKRTRVYDETLALMFGPWADDIVERAAPARGATALDVACGPGTVTRLLAWRVGMEGRVLATDVSPAMLEIARGKTMAPGSARISWIESPAAPLRVPDACADAITCQQGLQFFPDKTAALAEMRRALRPTGTAIVTAWTRIEEQPPFFALQAALAEVAPTLAPTPADGHAGPFSLTGDEAAEHARAAGFTDVVVERVTLPVVLDGGPERLVHTLQAWALSDNLAALDDATRAALVEAVRRRVPSYAKGRTLRETLTASVLTLR